MRAILAALAVALALTACGGGGSGSSPDLAACKAAMKKDFSNAVLNPSAPPASEPPACHGVSTKELKKIVGEIISEKLGGQ